jgi:hypothetical protein
MYAAGDAEATLGVLIRAVGETARAHYSVEQIEAWLIPAVPFDRQNPRSASAIARVSIRQRDALTWPDLRGARGVKR